MKIAVLSGKGGTGKTLVSVNLAYVLNDGVYLDCDVEEPNGHLFFKPKIKNESIISTKVPKVDIDLCDGCRKCVEFCRFNALAYAKGQLIVFDNLCHSCGGCLLICPKRAITEIERPIGLMKQGLSGKVKVMSGFLNPQEPSGVLIIKRLLAESSNEDNVIIDCPPGSGCLVIESIQQADFCLLVVEPSLFGIHDFHMIYQLVNLFEKPHAIVINKSFGETKELDEFCAKKKIKILGRIPYDKELAELNSNALIIASVNKKYYHIFSDLLKQIKGELNETNINS